MESNRKAIEGRTSASCSTLVLSSEEAWAIRLALRHAASDIWQTLRVTELNLTGKDPNFPEMQPIVMETPTPIHRAGADESHKVHSEVEEALRLLAGKMHGMPFPSNANVLARGGNATPTNPKPQ